MGPGSCSAESHDGTRSLWIHLVRFRAAALAPSLPSAVRVRLGSLLTVFFFVADAAAFLMFFLAAARCLAVVICGQLFFFPPEAFPPLRPPFLAGALFSALPRPMPDFFPPPLDLLTVAHARRSASPFETPRFS